MESPLEVSQVRILIYGESSVFLLLRTTAGKSNMKFNCLNYRPSLGEFKEGKSYQKFIHFPKTGLLSTKDNLCRLMKKMKVKKEAL